MTRNYVSYTVGKHLSQRLKCAGSKKPHAARGNLASGVPHLQRMHFVHHDGDARRVTPVHLCISWDLKSTTNVSEGDAT